MSEDENYEGKFRDEQGRTHANQPKGPYRLPANNPIALSAMKEI